MFKVFASNYVYDPEVKLFYRLTLPNSKQYIIKVESSTKNLQVLKLYHESSDMPSGWAMFATCSRNDNIEHVVKLHYGSKGTLSVYTPIKQGFPKTVKQFFQVFFNVKN